MLTILSSLAENESISISRTINGLSKEGLEMEHKLSYPPYGYDYVDGQIV